MVNTGAGDTPSNDGTRGWLSRLFAGGGHPLDDIHYTDRRLRPWQAVEPGSEFDMQPVFDRIVAQSLGPLCAGLSLVFLVLAIIGFMEGRQGWLAAVEITDVVSAFLYLGIFLLLRNGRFPIDRINFLGFAIGSLALANVLIAYYFLDEAIHLIYLPIIMIGYGTFMLSLRWLAASLALVVGAGILVVWPTLTPELFLNYLSIMLPATLLSLIMVIIRRWSAIATQTALIELRAEAAERRRIETRLNQAQRLESIGTLVSGVAHDFNNLLTAVIGYSDLVLSQLEKSSPIREELLEIRKSGEMAANLTSQLLAFSRQQVLNPRTLDVNEVVRNARGLIRPGIKENIDLRLDLDPEAGFIKVDESQMGQVLLNLAANAADAMPDGGSLTIQTRALHVGQAGPDEPSGDCVELTVTDTGTGMSAEVTEHIFEPFFTTKPPGRGTGLGLATVYGIVKQSNASIAVATEPGQGTRFTIRFPRCEEPATGVESQSEDPAAAGDSTVLLVDDDSQVRSVVADTLRSSGYRVHDAANANEALQLAGRIQFDLLLSDVVMPGMTGIALANQLRELGHSPAVLLMSGYAAEEALEDPETFSQAGFIAKPFRNRALVEAVERTIKVHRQRSARVDAFHQ